MEWTYIRITEPLGKQSFEIDSDELSDAVEWMDEELNLREEDVKGGLTMPKTSIRMIQDPDTQGTRTRFIPVTFDKPIGTTIGKVMVSRVMYKRVDRWVDVVLEVDSYLDGALTGDVLNIQLPEGVFSQPPKSFCNVNEPSGDCRIKAINNRVIRLAPDGDGTTRQTISVHLIGKA